MSIVLDAVAAATASVSRLYPLGSVPSEPVMPYGVYSATLGRGDVTGLNGDEGMRWGQVVVQAFAKTASAALDKAEQARETLIGVRLAVTGYDTTPCTQGLDPSVYRDPDAHGVVAVTQTFSFTASN